MESEEFLRRNSLSPLKDQIGTETALLSESKQKDTTMSCPFVLHEEAKIDVFAPGEEAAEDGQQNRSPAQRVRF